jgi:hypothetical protein
MANASKLTKSQTITLGPKEIEFHGKPATIKATIRFDDRCGNGYNTFSITGEIRQNYRDVAGGCLHSEIGAAFPEIAPMIRWHLVSTDGPMHYIANTLYWLGYKGYCDGKAGSPPSLERARKTACWPDMPEGFLSPGRMVLNGPDSGKPAMAATGSDFLPEQALDVARARQRFVMAEERAKMALEQRLPALLTEFRAAVESLGFTW